MCDIVCTPFLSEFILVNRRTQKSFQIPEQLYRLLHELFTSGAVAPIELREFLVKIGVCDISAPISHSILVRPLPQTQYVRASYEVTEACNFSCKHCLLGQVHRKNLTLVERKKLIDLLAMAGCVWLQITGGEATLDKYFVETWKYAYQKGFILTLSTNGSRLATAEIQECLKECPPHRVAVSIYGGTSETSYDLTQDVDAFENLMAGLQAAKNLGLKVRCSIIMTTFNQHERSQMVAIAEQFGFEHPIYWELLPTLTGSRQPVYISSDCDRGNEGIEKKSAKLNGRNWYDRCGAGQTFFHVDCQGNASICQSARSLQLNLLEHGVEGLEQLDSFARQLLETDKTCTDCVFWQQCTNCPPKLALYRNSGGVPDHICHFQIQ